DANAPLPPHAGYFELVAEEDRATIERLLHSAWTNKEPHFTVRHRVRKRDSGVRWFEVSGQLVAVTSEQRMLVGVVRDITEQHIQACVLATSQERLDLALNSVELGTWDWHIPSATLYASARASELQGISEEPYHGDFRTFFASIPLTDRQLLRQAYKDL